MWNNPLNATDPSGYIGWFIFKAFLAYAISDVIVTIGINSGWSSGLIQAVSLAATFWIGGIGPENSTLSFQTQVAVVATLGGITSVLQGGKFGHGFVAAGLSAIAGAAIDGAKLTAGKEFLAKVIVGGTISEVTGGKFANGAAGAVFAMVVQSVGAGLGSEAATTGEATEAYSKSERGKSWTEAEANAIDAQIQREQQQSQRAAIELSEGKGSSSGMSVFGESSQGDVAAGFQDISNGLANLDSSQIGKMSHAQNNNHGGTALAVAVDKTTIYLSKTYVNGLLEGQRGTTFIHEMGHLLGWSHKHMDWNLTLNVSHTTSLISLGNRFGNLRNPYAYEWYLNN